MSRRVLLIAAVAILAALPLTFGTFWINMVITALIFSLAVFSVNLLTGLTGLLSFGQAGFVGIGAYTLGVLAKQGHPPILAGLYGVLLAMLCGFLLGLPAARLKGHYLAIGTLGFGILIYQLLTNSVDVTRGPMGLIGIPTGGIDRQTWYLIMLSRMPGGAGRARLHRPLQRAGRHPEDGAARRDRSPSERHQHLRRQADRVYGFGGPRRIVRRPVRRLCAVPHARPVQSSRSPFAT